MYLQFIRKRGVSMMEVLTAVVIISILSSTSYVGWRKYIRKVIMTEAKVNLSMVFASQVQYRATCNTYHPDLETIGALPKGKLHYNVGAPFDNTNDWGYCLTEREVDCSDCSTHFDEVCCSKADFDDFSSDCTCYIDSKYQISKSAVNSHYSSNQYCGSDLATGTLRNKFCMIAATAINRDISNDSEWDVWVVNHLNIVKQVYYPGD